MKVLRLKTGFTLIEMLLVVAVMAILSSVLIAMAGKIQNKANTRLMENTFSLIDSALQEYQDFGYKLDLAKIPAGERLDFYSSLKFPADCNGFDTAGLEAELADTLNANSVTIEDEDRFFEYAGIEAMVFMLRKVPASRQLLEEVDDSLLSDENTSRKMNVTLASALDPQRDYFLIRINDPWGEALRYDYYDESLSDYSDRQDTVKNFPMLKSAGPDKIFGTADDITSR
jgi:prepilin-type N-terminal cleavage/methylation domain-containing protein